MKTIPQPVVSGERLDLTIDINELLRNPFVVQPRQSSLPMPAPALHHNEVEVIVEEVPIGTGYVPKALVKAIKCGHVCQAGLIQIGLNEGVSNLAGIHLDNATDPAGGGKNLEDAFDLIPIKWTLKFHRHKAIA